MKRKLLRLCAAGSIIAILGVQASIIYADPADDIAYLEAQQEISSEELENAKASINALEDKKSSLLSQIDEHEQQLVKVIASIDILEGQISDKSVRLDELQVELGRAEEDVSVQYAAMKERIRYLYEEGGDAGWAYLLLGGGSEDLSSIVDLADYTQQLYDYDRRELDAYIDTVNYVEELKRQVASEKSALEVMKREQEDSRDYLQILIDEAKKTTDDIDAKLESARSIANEYVALIAEQNEYINALYAQQEAARLAQEQAEQERLAAEAAASYPVYTSVYDAVAPAQNTYYAEPETSYQTTPVYTEDTSSYSEPVYAEPAYTEPVYETPATYYEETYTDPAPVQEPVVETPAVATPAPQPTTSSGGTTGQDVINYALQYVGNPYVWGGTDLNNGADCSGFVQSVYRDMGYNISRTSYTQLNDGISVSYADAQPGDIIDYGSHVALYMGDGQIVHAANEELGITTSSNATYQDIVDVRRIIY